MPTNIRTWLDFALQQMAAESYLDQFVVQGVPLQQVLIDGNNDRRVISLDQFSGKTQFTDLQAQQFTQRYQIIDHHANDATGFSATLMKDLSDPTGKAFTLSFRSLEYQNQVDGGDWERDGQGGAAGELAGAGFALGQLVSMERYYQELKNFGKLPVGATLNVTGYSLGGHLATVFTALHSNEIHHTYIFNGAGMGQVGGVTSVLTEDIRIEQLIDAMDAKFLQFDPTGALTRSGATANVQTLLWYQPAVIEVAAQFQTTGTASLPFGGVTRTDGAFSKITQLFGHATSSVDPEVVANSGIHGPVTPVLIEGQPLVESLRELQYGNSHSITLLVDSLALQELFQTVDPNLTQAQMENIFKASSDATAGLFGQTHVAEGDTLEVALDALRTVFLGGQVVPTAFNDNAGGFGDLARRNEFYTNLQAVKAAVTGQTYQIVSLVNMPVETLKGHSLLPDATGMAYRYALKELNPFAVIGANYSQFHNPGDLDLYDPTTGNGSITLEYLKDRATFLGEKIRVNQATFPDVSRLASTTYYKDHQSQYEVGVSVGFPKIIFGDVADETISGSLLFGDRLYGGDGADTIEGLGGADYIEGNDGNDVLLSGGSGNDTLLGGQGDDTLDGGIGNDTLDGGLDNDILRGGAGLDRYISNFGADTIEDSDGKGVVEFHGTEVLLSGLRRTDDPTNVFRSADGTITLTKSGIDLVVTGSGPLTIKNFTSGQLGIRLVEEGTYAEATRTEFQKIDHYVQVGSNPVTGDPIFEPVYAAFFDDNANDTRNTAPIGGLVPEIDDWNNLIHAGGGNDTVITAAGDDQVYGEGGDDSLAGRGGHDRLYGGSGHDTINGDDVGTLVGGNDYLDGGEGNDVLLGHAGADILIAGGGNDHLEGDDQESLTIGNYGSDYLDGGDGQDNLHGVGGSDVLAGGAGNDFLLGDAAISQGGTPEAGGGDSLDGGSGKDYLDGQFGEDVLAGGLDDDRVNGGDGSDVLYGGGGDDILSGDLRITFTPVEQWTNIYTYELQEYRGAGGDDLLVGEDGHDTLLGGEGSDVLQGGIGNDTLVGGYHTLLVSPTDPLFWTLFTAAGNDHLDAGAGSDALYGGVGHDTFFGGDGNDTLRGGGGADVLEGGAGDDVLYGEYSDAELGGDNPFQSAMLALAGTNRLEGGAGQDQLFGGVRADTLLGGTGDDLIYGGADDDLLDGGDGADVLDGGLGSDIVHAGAGDDRLTAGMGADTLYGEDGHDELISGNENFESGDSILIGGTGNDRYVIDSALDLVVEEADAGVDSVRSFVSYTLPDQVEHLSLSGGGLTATGNALANELRGATHSTLDGLGGDDTLINGRWYRFGHGYGADRIVENDVSSAPYFPGGGGDAVQFTIEVTPDQVQWQRQGNDLVLSLDGTADTLTIPSFYTLAFNRGDYRFSSNIFLPAQTLALGGSPYYVAPSQVERFEFADGTVWGPEMFGGTMIGAYQANTYAFGRGDGQDTILDFDFTGEQPADVLQLKAGISPNDVLLRRIGDDLQLGFEGTTDQLTIQSHFASVFVQFLSFSGRFLNTYQLEQIQFTDGTVWDTATMTAVIVSQITDLIGTDAADILRGNARANTIQGLGGNDWLESFGNDDVLDGGVGNDTLLGGAGSDTYLFTRGDGADILEDDNGTGSDLNTIQFSASIAPTDLTLQGTTSGNLILRINGTTDQLTLDSYLDDPVYRAYQLTFADGTTWDTTEIMSRATGITRVGTPFNDSLSGTPLNDSLSGLGGNDTLWGDAGADLLNGGSGNDTYYFELGNGVETIEDTALPGEGNLIQFAPGITLTDLHAVQEGNVLTISVGLGGDALRLQNFDLTGANGSLVVTTIAFDDGSTVNLADLLSPIVNHAPTVATPLADLTVPEDAPVSLVVPANTFADEDAGDVLTLSASLADGTALPKWLTFDAATATFSGMPDDAQVGTLDLRVTATDQENLNVSDVFSLTVTNVNEAPTVAVPLSNQTAAEDTAFTFTVPGSTFTDVDQMHGDTLSYSATLAGGAALPTWLSFDPLTRTFSGTPQNQHVGALTLTVTATDSGNLSASTDFTLAVQNVNDAPTVAVPLADHTGAEDSSFSFIVPSTTFADEDVIHGDVLTYQATLVNGSPLPTWLNFNATTRTFSGMPGAGDAGSLQIAVTATDSGTLSAVDMFALVTSGPLPQTLVGTTGNDILTGGRGDDTLTGLAGNDTLNGGQGHDLLDGGTGTDTMQGGTGNDTYIVDVAGDVVTELANEGTDTVQSSLTYTVGANLENLTLTGTANLNGTGNALDNILTGNSGINVLTGGAGNDTYIVSAGDTVVENAGGGTDTVQSAVAWTLSLNVESLTLTGTANINGTGSSGNNVLIGNSGSNTLDGGSGNDTVDGGDGNDSILGGSGDDQLLGGLGNDVLNAGSGNDILSGGDGTDTLDGGAGDDQLLGGAGTDALTGGSGADQFTGGTGNDTLTGGSGNDRYNFARGDGQDTIIDSDPFPGNQDRAVFGVTINPLDLVISRQVNDLRLAIHGSSDQITVQNWYTSPTTNQVETIQAGNGQTLLNTQVDQLIQAMAGFTAQTGLTWDQALDQQPQQVQTVLAASWQ